MACRDLPAWRLLPGVSKGLWDYVHADHIATDYDEYFAYNQLFSFDEAVLRQHFTRPGTILDLGCGTGRMLACFARRGFRAVGVDLSLPMLRVVGEKAACEHLSIDRVLANMAQLDCFADQSVDYCISMFSTLGMVAESLNRRRVVEHVRRVLKPGGTFAVHVHNRWYNLFDPQGRRWLFTSRLACLARRGLSPATRYSITAAYRTCGCISLLAGSSCPCCAKPALRCAPSSR